MYHIIMRVDNTLSFTTFLRQLTCSARIVKSGTVEFHSVSTDGGCVISGRIVLTQATRKTAGTAISRAASAGRCFILWNNTT